jgi:hypothetical protein
MRHSYRLRELDEGGGGTTLHFTGIGAYCTCIILPYGAWPCGLRAAGHGSFGIYYRKGFLLDLEPGNEEPASCQRAPKPVLYMTDLGQK